jgi:hypothetical protein
VSARAGIALGCAMAMSVLAPSSGLSEGRSPTQEIWAGAEASSASWSAWTGITASLYGPLPVDGWRVRAVGGYGEYSYDSGGTKIRGTVTFTDALIGYHRQWGTLTVKAFLGLSAENHSLAPFDPESRVVGAELGGKVLLETWLDIDPRTWASIDLSWSSLYGGSYAARSRAGYRVLGDLSVGLEAAAIGNADYNGGRGGGFMRYQWANGEVSAAGGISIDRSREWDGYGTLSVLYRY